MLSLDHLGAHTFVGSCNTRLCWAAAALTEIAAAAVPAVEMLRRPGTECMSRTAGAARVVAVAVGNPGTRHQTDIAIR